MRISIIIVAIAAATTLAGPAQGQQKFPAKPVRLVVLFAPGSQSDVLARIIGPRLSDMWGQPVVVETRLGAGGTIAAALVARATPDGHTLLVTTTGFVIGAASQSSLPYEPLKDIVGVTQLGYGTSALVVAPSLGVKSVKELVALAQAKPGQVLFSSSGAGGGSHMNGERFRLAAGIKVQHVGFKGASESVLEVVAGRVHFCIQSLAAGLAFIRDGKLLALAVTTPQRSPLLPDVPAMVEVLPEYGQDGSFPLLAPGGTPLSVRRQISRDVARVFELPEVRERLQGIGFMAAPTTPEEHDQILRDQIKVFSKIVVEVGLKGK